MQNPKAATASDPVTQSRRTLAPGTDRSKRNGAPGSYLLHRAWADGVARLEGPALGASSHRSRFGSAGGR
jgi:hypothetical protein